MLTNTAIVDIRSAFGWSLLAAGLVSCVLAMLQYFNLEAMFASWVNATEPGYAFANLRQRNQFATLTNMALAVLLVWALRQCSGALSINQGTGLTSVRQGIQKPSIQMNVAVLAGAALLAIGNAASASRTGVVQIFLLCGLLAVWGGWRHRWVQTILFAAMCVYFAAAAALPYAAGFDWLSHGLFARLQAGDELCSSRITLWSNVLHLIGQKPWLGWGWGELDYAHFITLYNTSGGEPRFCDILDNAHNLPLHLAVELGVPTALLVCGGFAGWVIWQKPWAERQTDRQMAWAVMALVLLHSMLEYPLWYGPFQIAFGLCIYILLRKPEQARNPVIDTNNELNTSLAPIKRALTATKLIVLMASLLAVAYAAWDYHRVSQIYLQPEERSAAYRKDTLAHARKSWLFEDQALFAELILTPLSPTTAVWTYASARRLLHYSPEPRVAQKLIESAVMLDKDAEALAYLVRFKAAFPKEHAAWAKAI